MAGAVAGRPGGQRIVGVVPCGVAAGALAWCLVGMWRAAHLENYPWSAWTPVGYGAVKGVFLGLLAGCCAVGALRIGRADGSRSGRFAGLVFGGGLAGGMVPGTLRDFLGDPQPRTLYYYDGPRPGAQWYWRPLLSEWLAYTVLPALGCAVLLTAGALLAVRCARRGSVGWVLPALVGLGLLVLPDWAGGGAPEPVGGGGHVNESAAAGITVLATGWGLLVTAGVVRSRRRGRRRADGPGAAVTVPVSPP
ncbi:hypothetical protein ACFVWY_15735 [Streptomyces sp. NPDC058195]|uniref:hypothetical protein n=1 Tax=Streptomyces sp. NPDC058195 TaxID=3346375 RepID=UPI0036E63757